MRANCIHADPKKAGSTSCCLSVTNRKSHTLRTGGESCHSFAVTHPPSEIEWITTKFSKIVNLYTLLESLEGDPKAPHILINVSLADLRQLMVDTIDATRERLLPLFIRAEEDKLLTKKEVATLLNICETSVWKLVKQGKLTSVNVGRSVRYRKSEVTDLLNTGAYGRT